MDLAKCIVQAADMLHQRDITNNRFKIELFYHFRYKYDLFVMPTATELFIEFRGMVFRWRKGDETDFHFVLEFLLAEMAEDVKRKVAHDVRNNNYIPLRDPRFDDMCVEVSYEGQRKFHNVYTHVRPKEIIIYYIRLLELIHRVHND
jgi:hypothetical protein